MENQERVSAGLKILAFYWLVNAASSLVQSATFIANTFSGNSSYGPSWTIISSNIVHTLILVAGAYLGFTQPPFIKRLCGAKPAQPDKEPIQAS